MPNRSLKLIVSSCFLFIAYFCLPNHSGQAVSKDKLNRNQVMLLNLKSAPMSAGYFLINSYHTSKSMSQDLERSLNQIEAVDKAYAKYRHRPDDRFMQRACLKITLARQTAQDLEQQVKDAFAELKSSIEEALITDENFPENK